MYLFVTENIKCINDFEKVKAKKKITLLFDKSKVQKDEEQ